MTVFSSRLALLGGALLLVVVAASVLNSSLLLLDLLGRNLGVRLPHFQGYEDLVRMLTGPALLLFLPYCQASKGHIVADFASGMLGKRVRLLLEWLWQLLAAIIAAALAWAMFAGMLQAADDNLRTPISDWPVWPFMLLGVIGVAGWGLVAAAQFFSGFSQNASQEGDEASK